MVKIGCPTGFQKRSNVYPTISAVLTRWAGTGSVGIFKADLPRLFAPLFVKTWNLIQ